MKVRLLAAAVLTLASVNANSASPHGGTASLGLQLEAGFSSYMAKIDPDTLEQPPLPANLAALVTENPALPAPMRSIAPLSANHAVSVVPDGEGAIKVCVTTPAVRKDNWEETFYQMSTVGWKPSRSLSCIGAYEGSGLPTGNAAQLLFFKRLDRDDVPLATHIASFPKITLPENARLDAVALPAITLVSVAGSTENAPTGATIVIENPRTPPDPVLLLNPDTVAEYQRLWDEASIHLSSLSIRSPFVAEHTCAKVGPKQLCAITVDFPGSGLKPGTVIPGSLFFDFDTKHPSRVGFLGRVGS